VGVRMDNELCYCANPECNNTFIQPEQGRLKLFCCPPCNKKVYRVAYKKTKHGLEMIRAGELRAKIRNALKGREL